MTAKIRRIDYSPDEMIAGVAGRLDPVDFGIYWMICTLIYSHGGPIDDDPKWIAGLFKKTNPRTIRAAIDRLEACSKLMRIDGELMVNRCRTELERASNRTRTWAENGAKGGRPINKNNDIAKPNGFSSENRASNHQLSTINHQQEVKVSSEVKEPSEEVFLPVSTSSTGCDAQKIAPPRKAKINGKDKTPGSAVWEAYSQAYEQRYHAKPVRNARTNALASQLVQRLGAGEAPEVAAFYVGHQNRYYVGRGHALECLVKDAEKIRTEWQTGALITAKSANDIDQRQATAARYHAVLAKYEREADVH